MQMADKEMQEKMFTHRILESRLDAVTKQRDMIVQKIMEIHMTLSSIDEIEKNSDVLVNIGSEVHAFGKITDNKKIIVELGAGVALEKTTEDGKSFLEKRKTEMQSVLNQAQMEIEQISFNLQQLELEIQRASQKAG